MNANQNMKDEAFISIEDSESGGNQNVPHRKEFCMKHKIVSSRATTASLYPNNKYNDTNNEHSIML